MYAVVGPVTYEKSFISLAVYLISIIETKPAQQGQAFYWRCKLTKYY
jgi:hypothetical protein